MHRPLNVWTTFGESAKWLRPSSKISGARPATAIGLHDFSTRAAAARRTCPPWIGIVVPAAVRKSFVGEMPSPSNAVRQSCTRLEHAGTCLKVRALRTLRIRSSAIDHDHAGSENKTVNRSGEYRPNCKAVSHHSLALKVPAGRGSRVCRTRRLTSKRYRSSAIRTQHCGTRRLSGVAQEQWHCR